jgi:hypothetical protein
MNLTAYPEAYINSTSNITISNSYSAILPSNVLKHYEREILENEAGCIFKITYNNTQFGCESFLYISCLEFSAPDNTCYLSNKVFDELLMDVADPGDILIEPFHPPQATFIKFQMLDTVIDQIEDIKTTLEELLNNNYKFIRLNQTIELLGEEVKVVDLQPYDVCLINNTELEVEFDIMKKVPVRKPKIEEPVVPKIPAQDDNEPRVNTEDDGKEDEEEVPRLTSEELRLKRLEFFRKK